MLYTPPFNSASFIIIISVVLLFFVIFFYLLILQLHRRRILHAKEMTDIKLQYEQTIVQSQLEIQEQTFRNISQEIHDNIGQVLSLAKLNLNTISTDSDGEKIKLTEELLAKAISDLRDLSKSLNSEKITDLGICEAIKQELTLITKTTSLQTKFNCLQDDLFLTSEQTIIVFRMIQEIFNNIIKHAKATELHVQINSGEDIASIIITDNGQGFEIENLNKIETGIGLKSIKQRSRLLNATLNIQSTPGKGTSIEIELPQ